MPTSADPEQLQNLVVRFVRAFGLHRSDRTPCGQPVSISEAHALMELARGESLSQGELSARLRLEKSSVSRLVAQLEGQGHVQRRRDPRDGRVLRLGLTAAGLALATHLGSARAAKFKRLVAAIPAADRDRVVDGLNILVRPWPRSDTEGAHR